ncbi:WecB/TagA/CpsF family glycosyltransferase [Labilibaculum euxinus]|uniref:WecB/TagA/CpsF family glycosyltransferase n=1 Tax=Labilibaculum euxinus TaxID=2686357 RepID=A0A7M4D736_9BACT|nr:WecB/TagA/CpsF family glycosyltransferase [Labilibaculum euxinus]MUP38465.1 WecB/TagA/CpsF family glycosyltransferase [Labilibaculum euxinus]MVB07670.1 WecB/TagA/CpsF family glycosyltransferase [Labilibaculum euxinus]
MKKRITIMNSPVDVLTMKETLHLIDDSIRDKKPIQHIVVNAAKLVHMQTDTELYKSVVASDIINADGMAVVWAAGLLGEPLPERVSGVDLMQELVILAAKKKYRIFFFGGKEEVVSEVVRKYTSVFGEEIIAGFRNGYFNKDQEADIAAQIAASNADILFVAISSPTKEIFLNTYKDQLKVSFIMGVGGSFDVVAGKVKRAPLWMQNSGLEWFYRFLQEPRRMWKRYLTTNSLFLYYIFKERIQKFFR